jgi:hypothetical protein
MTKRIKVGRADKRAPKVLAVVSKGIGKRVVMFRSVMATESTMEWGCTECKLKGFLIFS